MKSVLLLGNGIDRSFNSHGISWGKLLDKMTTNKSLPSCYSPLPFPLEIVLRTNDQVDEVLKEYHEDLYSSAEDDQLRSILTKIMTLGFDDILTTNYDYTLEGTALYPEPITKERMIDCMKHTDEVKRAENKYMLHTYNTVQCNGFDNRIWHIHGEARKPGSIVIGHYMYVNMVSKWQEILNQRKNSYKKYDHSKPSPCWLDSFIMGNVYILGFGFDFSELDLWWLINRKKRERTEPHGKVIFYEPESTNYASKYALLSAYGVEIRHLGFKLAELIEEDSCEEDREAQMEEKNRINRFNASIYKDFYNKAIEDIEKDMNGR